MKSHLAFFNITEFKSLNEVIAFQNNHGTLRQQIIANSENAILEEKTNLISGDLQLKEAIELKKDKLEKELQEQINNSESQLQILVSSNSHNVLKKITCHLKIYFLKRKIRKHELSFSSKVIQSVQSLNKAYQNNEKRYHFITSGFQEAVIENCIEELQRLDQKKAIIDEVNNSIYGAIGEQKVVKELEKLSDDYVLINDYCLTFNPPFYNRNENEYIKSIQADHLLIAPSGLFLIETKNWSEQSLNSLSLRSPVSQLMRTSYALFMVLNDKVTSLGLKQHHWGKKKITLKNILVLINKKPLEEFQYIKVLTLNQLLNYITYFPSIFTQKETEEIANELVSLSKK